MRCPVCDTEMIILELNQIEIDYCAGCGGIWLDDGELELLMEDHEAKEKLLETIHHDPDNAEKPRRCPRCNKKMNKVFAGEHKEVLLDQCRNKHGLWFDAGELRHVLELGSLDPQNKVIGLINEMFADTLSKGKQQQ